MLKDDPINILTLLGSSSERYKRSADLLNTISELIQETPAVDVMSVFGAILSKLVYCRCILQDGDLRNIHAVYGDMMLFLSDNIAKCCQAYQSAMEPPKSKEEVN